MMTDMTKPYDGGPAFPQTRQQWQDSQTGGRFVAVDYTGGMTLRDWFAGQALAGLIQGYTVAYGSPTSRPQEVVREAYNYADAMLAARDAK